MKKLFLSAAAAIALTAGSASAQAPAAPAPAGQPGCAQCEDPGTGSGWGFGLKSKGWLSGKLHGIFSNHHGGRPPQVLPTAQGGQLVFPQNPFIRGPRDYFMFDER